MQRKVVKTLVKKAISIKSSVSQRIKFCQRLFQQTHDGFGMRQQGYLVTEKFRSICTPDLDDQEVFS